MKHKRLVMQEGAKGNEPPTNIRRDGGYYMGKGMFVDFAKLTPLGYLESLPDCIKTTIVTGEADDENIKLEAGLAQLGDMLKAAHKAGGKVIFIGNGGSAAIASHMAIDFCKNKGIRAQTFNDAPTLTALGNDFGYDRVFSKQIEYYGREDDIAVIISSSGRSLNIIAAADEARTRGLSAIVTLSGMNPANALRHRGNLNFYVPCASYGLVELTHLSLLHSLVIC